MAQYVYDMTKKSDVDNLISDLKSLGKIFESKKFKSFIADKCLEVVKQICDETEFWEEHSEWASKLEEYKHGHKVQIGKDYVLVFNDTYYEPEELWWLSDNLKERYAEGLSVSYLIEYGSGIKGTAQEDWETNVNGKESSWWYKNPDDYPKGSMKYFPQEGKFIYFKLAYEVEKNFELWLDEYLEKEKW